MIAGAEVRAPAVSTDLPTDDAAPASARRALEPLRDVLATEEFVDVRLLVSELVVDELRCGVRGRDRAIHLGVTVEADTLRIELTEGWEPGAAAPTRPRPGDPGWGVYLAQLLGDRWGAEPAGDGTTIWVEKRIATA